MQQDILLLFFIHVWVGQKAKTMVQDRMGRCWGLGVRCEREVSSVRPFHVTWAEEKWVAQNNVAQNGGGGAEGSWQQLGTIE